MSLHFACRSPGRVLKASREVIRGRRLLSDAESTSTAAGANAAVAVGKGVSWESVAKDFVRNGGASFLATAGLLVGLGSNLEKSITNQTTTSIGDLRDEIRVLDKKSDMLSSDTKVSIEKPSTEMKVSIEKLSSEIQLSIVELRYGIDKKIDKLDTKIGRLMWTTAALSLASLVSTLMVLSKK